jgi:hypothetical protein
MRIFLVLLFMSFGTCYGQLVYKTPYMVRMDSLAVANMGRIVSANGSMVDKSIKTFSPSKYVKFTLKTFINADMIAKLDNTGGLSDLDLQDYAGMGRFDIRVKVYTSTNTRFISRVIASGISAQSYSYSCGFIIKF